MSLAPINPNCPLCVGNNRLRGGEIYAEGNTLYVYLFRHEDGSVHYALILPKEHHAGPHTLPTGWGDEFGRFYGQLMGLLNGAPHNGYWNYGETAGQTVMDHWHVRIESRSEDEPASGMGFALLIKRYNTLVRSLQGLLNA
jgi:hypothetical protein